VALRQLQAPDWLVGTAAMLRDYAAKAAPKSAAPASSPVPESTRRSAVVVATPVGTVTIAQRPASAAPSEGASTPPTSSASTPPWPLYASTFTVFADMLDALAPMAGGQFEDSAAKLSALLASGLSTQVNEELHVFAAQQVRMLSVRNDAMVRTTATKQA